MTNKAALIAVVAAFVVGLIGSLAVRPPGQVTAIADVDPSGGIAERHRWKVPGVFQSTLPVLGDNPLYVFDIINRAAGGG
ncbi:MAG: hypothetical protein ACI96M_004029, partial [Candidatus Azotimanducaceae bacterium]